MKKVILILIMLLSLLPAIYLGWVLVKKSASKSIVKMQRVENQKGSKPKQNGYGCFTWFILVLAVVLLATGTYKSMKYMKLKNDAVSAQGVISKMERKGGDRKSNSNNPDYDVYVTFTAEGSEYTFKSQWYHSGMNLGDSLPVVYSPDHPEKAMVSGRKANSGPIVAIVIGVILFLFWISMLRINHLIKIGKIIETSHGA